MSDGSLFDLSGFGNTETNSARFTFDAEGDPRKQLEAEIQATKQMHNAARVRLEELERVADTVSGISLLSNVSDAVKEASIEAIVNEALSGGSGKA